jgi:hypothetical protein
MRNGFRIGNEAGGEKISFSAGQKFQTAKPERPTISAAPTARITLRPR